MIEPEAHFEAYQDGEGKYRWRLVAANGEIVAQGEAYETKQGVQVGIATVVSIIGKGVIPVTVWKG